MAIITADMSFKVLGTGVWEPGTWMPKVTPRLCDSGSPPAPPPPPMPRGHWSPISVEVTT